MESGSGIGKMGPVVKGVDPEVRAAFAFEDPKFMSVEQLQPLSARKQWKLKHRKKFKRGN